MRHASSPMPADTMHPASVSPLNAAILENIDTRPQLGDWLQSPTRDIHAHLANLAPAASSSSSSLSSPSLSLSPSTSTATTLVDGPVPSSSSCASTFPHTRSLPSGASMPPTCLHQPNAAAAHPPSLYNYSDATPTETSISTGLASQFTGVPLLEEVNGVLERRQTQHRHPLYECAFWFLSCTYISSDEEEWKTHCLSHFRGQEPPRSVQCPLCEFRETWGDGWTAWTARMEHIAWVHTSVGETLKTSRPDFHLFQHLWQKRLIGDQDLKELKGGNHNLTRTPSNFVTTNSRRERDMRSQRSQHVGHRMNRP